MISSTLLQMLIIHVRRDFECCSEMLFLKHQRYDSLIPYLSSHLTMSVLWNLCSGYYGASGETDWQLENQTIYGKVLKTLDSRHQRAVRPEKQEIHKVSPAVPQLTT